MGSKHDVLTEDEFRVFSLHPRVFHLLQECAERLGLPVERLRVLDWGCGRGRTVARLLEMGIDAYGVDIDPRPIRNGFDLLRARGKSPEQRLISINADCRTPFADGTFDVVLSDQVLEHVSDLGALATELARITRPGGGGLHVFPARWRMIEPHLFIPIVHWLPKNRLRLWYLWLFLARLPEWRELRGKHAAERMRIYYEYSLNKTFYRSLREIRTTFERHGFALSDYPNGRRTDPLAGMSAAGQGFFAWWMRTFREVALNTVRL